MTDAQEGLRREWNRAHAAAAERSAAMDRLDQARGVASGILAELDNNRSLYQLEFSRLCDRNAHELNVPGEYWMAAECTTSLGNFLLKPQGSGLEG